MPIAFPFFLFAKPAESALRWIRVDTGPPLLDKAPDPRVVGAQRRLADRLSPHLRRDLFRDE